MSIVDVDALERLLIGAARDGRTMTYAEVLAHFGRRIAPRRAYALSRDLGEVCARNRARNEPELAVLVVRKADGLPGEGFFKSLWLEGSYDGPAEGFAARNHIRGLQEEVFAYFGSPRAGGSEHAQQREDQHDDDHEADEVDDVVHGEAPPVGSR